MRFSRRNFFEAGLATALTASSTDATAAPPCRTPLDARVDGFIRLNHNENPYGPLPGVEEAFKNTFAVCNRYPYEVEDAFAAMLADWHRVDPRQVLVGCGSTEMLKLAASSVLDPHSPLVIADPSFENAIAYATAQGAPIRKIPLTPTYAHDLEAMREAAGHKAGLVYICNPNNPTASLTHRSAIEAFLRNLPGTPLVVIDEAYHDFAVGSPGYQSFLDYPVDDPRVVVLRTFSKFYGMAGMRLGYAVFPYKSEEARAACQQMIAQRQMDSTNIGALKSGMALLKNLGGAGAVRQRILAQRAAFIEEIKARQLSFIPSVTNFVFFDAKRPASAVNAFFKKNNIKIGRPFPPYNTHVRVSMGLPEHMQTFWQVWDQMPRDLA